MGSFVRPAELGALGAAGLLVLLAGCGREEPSSAAPRRDAAAAASASPAPVGSVAAKPSPSPPASAEPSATLASPEATLATTSPTPAGSATYAPRDECAALPGWSAFRGKLAAAVKARDAAALTALADPAVKLDFGGGAGREELTKRLAGRADLWGQLDALLALGCATKDGLAVMPWVFWNVPDAVDGYSAMLVTGTGVPLRARPAAGAPVRRTLDWALVSVGDGFDPKAAFAEVTLEDGRTKGFVANARLRSLLGYRVIAEREGEAWRITAFIAGD